MCGTCRVLCASLAQLQPSLSVAMASTITEVVLHALCVASLGVPVKLVIARSMHVVLELQKYVQLSNHFIFVG